MEIIQFDNVITLGQFLKHEGIIGTGGEAKWFLGDHDVYINGELETRRGKKLHQGDVLDMGEFGRFEIEYNE